ncbi:MAG: heme exporter protein CcmD [Ilumatobacteraceae bacterium]|nr:MAG: heme exporter protein CcmD [Actinomycetota bacterium]
MDHAGFIIASYVVTLGGVGAFAWAVLRRGRRLVEQLGDEELPWT